MTNNRSVIGARLKEARTAKGYSLEQVAEACQIQQYQTVSSWEHENTVPSLEKLLLLCKLYDCDIGYIIGEYDCKTRINTDIQAETGLSETVINQLRERILYQYQLTSIQALNSILEFNGGDILELLTGYLFNTEKPVELDDGRILSADTIATSYLQEINGELQALKRKLNGGA